MSKTILIRGGLIIGIILIFLILRGVRRGWEQQAQEELAKTEVAFSKERTGALLNNTMGVFGCAPTSWLLKCYRIDAGACPEEMRVVLRGCLDSAWPQGKAQLDKQELEPVVKAAGSCAFKTIAEKHTGDLQQTSECLNPTPADLAKTIYGPTVGASSRVP